jgi:hypothetical protein
MGWSSSLITEHNHFTHQRLLPVLAQSPTFPPVFSRTQLNGLDWKSDSRQLHAISGRNALKLAGLRFAELTWRFQN